MFADLKLKPLPFEIKDKLKIIIVGMGIISIWIIGVGAFLTLPEKTTINFDASGNPRGDDSSIMFLFISGVLSIAPLIVFSVVVYRFTLINNYPYLLNLPAFFINIQKVPENKRSQWVNQYFSILLNVTIFLVGFFNIIEIIIFISAINQKLEPFLFLLVIFIPIIVIVYLILSLRKMASEIKE